MLIDQYKIEEQKKKGGKVKQPPFIVCVRASAYSSPARQTMTASVI